MHHLLLRGKYCENKVLWWSLVLSDFSQVKDFLFANGYGIVDGLAVQVDVPLGVFGFIDLVEYLPSDVPVLLLFGVIKLLLRHWMMSVVRVLVLTLKVIIHLGAEVIVFVYDLGISFFAHFLDLLWTHLMATCQIKISWNVLVCSYKIRSPESHSLTLLMGRV